MQHKNTEAQHNPAWRTRLSAPALRRGYALAWSALMTLILLQSSSQPLIGPPAPPGPPDLGREILLTIGHVIAFGVMTLLWWWALRAGAPHRWALRAAVIIALLLGAVTEMLQTLLDDRNASLVDLAANWGAALLAAWVIQRHHYHHSPNRSSHSSTSFSDR